jgi:DNA-directed RNA polymerase subunit RPC12/RpoP
MSAKWRTHRNCSGCKKEFPKEELDCYVCAECKSKHEKPKKKGILCKRCGGSGIVKAYEHVAGGTCFKCGGDGVI